MNQVIQTVNSTLDMNRVLAALLKSLQATHAFEAVAVFRLNEVEHCLTGSAISGRRLSAEDLEAFRSLRLPLLDDGGMLARAAVSQEPVHVTGGAPGGAGWPGDARLHSLVPYNSAVALPLLFQGNLIGVLAFFATEGRFQLSGEDIASLGNYVAQLANAVNNAQLYERIQRDQADLRHQKEQMEKLASKLSKYLSPQVYQSIFTGEKQVRLETYRKKLTIFFSDIVGFTELTDTMESEALLQLLNTYLNAMSEIALRYGGTIDKYIGDAIMIFFGDPESRGAQEDALACILMALEMRERMRQLAYLWEAQGHTKPMKIRMGINTGYCTVGNFGSEDRLDYTIIGGMVNLASRLESHSEPNQILISHHTYLLVKDKVECRRRGEVQVKGIAAPVETYEVVDLRRSLTEPPRVLEERFEGFELRLAPDGLAERERALAILLRAADELR